MPLKDAMKTTLTRKRATVSAKKTNTPRRSPAKRPAAIGQGQALPPGSPTDKTPRAETPKTPTAEVYLYAEYT